MQGIWQGGLQVGVGAFADEELPLQTIYMAKRDVFEGLGNNGPIVASTGRCPESEPSRGCHLLESQQCLCQQMLITFGG